MGAKAAVKHNKEYQLYYQKKQLTASWLPSLSC